MSTKEFLFFWA